MGEGRTAWRPLQSDIPSAHIYQALGHSGISGRPCPGSRWDLQSPAGGGEWRKTRNPQMPPGGVRGYGEREADKQEEQLFYRGVQGVLTEGGISAET